MTSRTAQSRGIALVLVLTMLVLLSALIVAFMTSATNERTSTVAASSAAGSRQIADTTINLVMSQIREATTQSASRSGNSVPTETAAWSSQPGAIRTFTGRQTSARATNSTGAWFPTYEPGSSDTVYKLYSSDRMQVSSTDYEGRDLPEEVKIIENWDRENPAEDYVDLNTPILIPKPEGNNVVEPRYPIIDPRARYDENNNPVSGAAPGIVEGFDIRMGIQDEKFLLEGGQTKVPYLPMPVRWLYVLADGSMGPASRATRENPIVGRTAFWVDDETSKLNINTASEPTYWDTPTASSTMESGEVSTGRDLISNPQSLSLGASQPVRGEYQRYPGHPATTALSPVLGWLANIKPTSPTYPRAPGLKDFKEMIYRMSPFLAYDRPTSVAGTVNPDKFLPPNNQANVQPPKLKFTTKRLYASVDEYIFKDERTRGAENPVPQVNVLSTSPTATNRLTPEAIEKVRFFLTASSRAPELNLFGRPRVTIWPVHADLARRTSFDDLFAFTSTIGGKPYYFTRSDAKDNVVDYNPLNQRLYKYLQGLTGDTQKDVPGFGSNFMTKYGARNGGGSERDQILTMMFDYMRTVNLVDTGTSLRTFENAKFEPYTPFYGPQGYGVQVRPFEWSGQVTPLQIMQGAQVQTMGLGRFLTVSEAALVFYRKGRPVREMDNSTPPKATGKFLQPPEIEAILLLEMATPMPGFPALKETFFTVVKAVRPTRLTAGPIQNVDMGFSPNPLVNICNVASHEVFFGRAFMPTLGYANQMHFFPDHRGPTNPLLTNDPNRSTATTRTRKQFVRDPSTELGRYQRNKSVMFYPYVSNAFNIGQEKNITFSGGSFEVEIWTGEAPSQGSGGDPRARLVQTITLDFPEAPLQVPAPEIPTGLLTAANANREFNFASRLTGELEGPWDTFRTDQYLDVVRGIEFTGGVRGSNGAAPYTSKNNKGDLRLGAALPVVPKEYYEPRENYMSKTTRLIHGLTVGHGDPVTGFSGTRGVLAQNGTFRASKPPILPAGINGVTRSDGGPGDWDRGLSKHMSGAFANKVDEGNVNFDYGNGNSWNRIPYFLGRGIEETGRSYFSPNRQIASAVMMGSLPTGVIRGLPWQTLLFRPDRERATSHPGMKFPQDHLFLDLFHMPVVEPYAISEPFSTAGKVNLNYVIAPFGYASGGGGNNQDAKNPRSYIRRDTALRGILKSTKVMAVPTRQPEGAHTENPLQVTTQFRFDIDMNRTLEQFEDRIKDPSRGLFRSASEICEMDLFPKGLNVSTWDRFWNTDYAQTGDNMRERPYAHIYPRLTTRSNVYTIHMRCQVIKKAAGTRPNEFVEGRDQVTGEYRGSATIERYIDPNDPDLENYDPNTQSAEPYYRFRVVNSKQFTAR